MPPPMMMTCTARPSVRLDAGVADDLAEALVVGRGSARGTSRCRDRPSSTRPCAIRSFTSGSSADLGDLLAVAARPGRAASWPGAATPNQMSRSKPGTPLSAIGRHLRQRRRRAAPRRRPGSSPCRPRHAASPRSAPPSSSGSGRASTSLSDQRRAAIRHVDDVDLGERVQHQHARDDAACRCPACRPRACRAAPWRARSIRATSLAANEGCANSISGEVATRAIGAKSATTS